MSSLLFTPYKLRDLEIKNRIMMAPMCMYSGTDGVANDFHFVHLVSRAIGQVGLIIVEATGIEANGRISTQCLGLYTDEHTKAFQKITSEVKKYGSRIGIQLNHSGRKGVHGNQVIGPSPIPFNEKSQVPHEMTKEDIFRCNEQFKLAALKAIDAGFDLVQIHMAHGYLMHEFLSPFSNHRTDEFGGTLENRMRFPLMVAESIRKIWPENLPVMVRLSATDWIGSKGWDIQDSILFCQELKKIGIDLVDISTGGNVATASIPVGPHYQAPFAEKIKNQCDIPTAAVGLITNALEAEKLLQQKSCDLISLGRVLLRDPYWAVDAKSILDQQKICIHQYERGY